MVCRCSETRLTKVTEHRSAMLSRNTERSRSVDDAISSALQKLGSASSAFSKSNRIVLSSMPRRMFVS
jgi:hypothetical protein